jgi:predicted dienelactone hydrolase
MDGRLRLGRRTALLTAGLVSAAALALLAVPSVGLIGQSTGSTTAGAATTPEELAASIAAENETSAVAASVEGSGEIEEAPYPVATLTVTLVDPTRSTPARGSTAASSSRTLTVTISYPVTKSAAQFPLVVFVHGYDVDAATYADLEQEIAQEGFVVAAPDFPLSSSALAGEAERDIVEQAADVSFVITSLLDESSRPTALAGLIADTKVGVIGHSDGAVTAAGVAFNDDDADPRIGAAVTLSGAEAFFPGSWFDASSSTGELPALLAIHGTADEINPFAASETLFDDATGPKWLVGVTGGSHLEPFTSDPVRARVASLVATFFHAQLEGEADAFAGMDDAASAPGLTLVAQG